MARLAILGPTELSGAAGRPVNSGTLQAKRLVLLAYLCLTPRRGFVRRDSLLALFWPELPTEQARHSLRQSLHYLRATLGREAIVGRGDDEVAASADFVWCDAGEFEERIAAGDLSGAVTLYRAELLKGVFVSEAAPELEQWMDEERSRLRRLAVRAAWDLAVAAGQQGQLRDAEGWARRALAFDPDDETSLRSLMALLERQGDRAGALRAYDEFARRLDEEHDAEPSHPTRALRASLSVAAPTEPSPIAPLPSIPGSAAPDSAAAARPPRVRLTAMLAFGALAAVVGLGLIASHRPGGAQGGEVLAVGGIIAVGGQSAEGDEAAANLRALLAADLARLSGVAVLSQARIHEMLPRARGRGDSLEQLAIAARHAGATELVEGRMRRTEAGRWRVDLQRVGLGDGAIRATLVIDGRDLPDLVSQITSQVAAAHRLAPPNPGGAGLSASLLARMSHERGLRALYRGDRAEARRHFRAALEADSGSVASAYQASALAASSGEGAQLVTRIANAAAAADSIPEFERLHTRALWAALANDPALVSIAESLASRYPADLEGRYALGNALLHAGDFTGAVDQLQAAIAADSARLGRARRADAPCRVCAAMAATAQAYVWMDSMDAAERWIRAWRRASPRDNTLPLGYMVVVLDATGRRAQALAILRDSLDPSYPAEVIRVLEFGSAIRAGDFAEMEGLLARSQASEDPALRESALWWDIIYQGTRGRHAAALAAADRFCALAAASNGCAQIRASSLLDLGRPGAAVEELRRQVARVAPDSTGPPGVRAQSLGWLLFHLGVARAAAGDTAGVWRLADSVQRIGRLSGYGRDRRLHFHLRGLVQSARGQHQFAEQAYRSAQWAPIHGFTGTDYRLAQELLLLDRPAAAVAVLEPTLRRTVTAMGSYLAQTELHALLAEALHRAGRTDQALQHLAWVESAWLDADPPVRDRLAALQRQLRGPPIRNPGGK